MSTETEAPMPADLPLHARERLADMKQRRLFTSDFSVNEFVLVREAGFDPLGMVMGSSIYQVMPNLPKNAGGAAGCELEAMTAALSEARSLAMNRMEEEAAALGADGIVGVRLTVNLSLNPQRQQWEQYREWNGGRRATASAARRTVQTGWFQGWQQLAAQQWTKWTTRWGGPGCPTRPGSSRAARPPIPWAPTPPSSSPSAPRCATAATARRIATSTASPSSRTSRARTSGCCSARGTGRWAS